MEIVFDEKPGEIYDVFYSLWFINNYDYAKKRKEEYGILKLSEFEQALLNLVEEKEIDRNKLKKYFLREMEPIKILALSSVWKYPVIEEYLEAIENLDEIQLRKKVIDIIQQINGDESKENITEELINSDDSVLKYMEDKAIPGEFKWELFLLLNNKEKYIKEFLDFIYDYIPIYNSLSAKRTKIMNQLNEEIKENVVAKGIDYLNKKTNSIIDFSAYENIYITTSVTLGLVIGDEDEKCYITIGPYIKNFLDKIYGEDLVENKLLFLRNICESSKFNILKLLLKKDYYGQEIAEALGLTKATVSHHMNYLVTAKIVNIEKDGVRYYYSINKDELRKNMIQTMNILGNEFELL